MTKFIELPQDDEHDLQESSPDLETIMQALTDPDILEPMDVYLPDAVAANPGLIHNVTPSSNPLIDTMPDVEETVSMPKPSGLLPGKQSES